MRFRVVLGIIVLCGYGLYGSLKSARDLLAAYQGGRALRAKDAISAYEERFFELQAALPPHGVVGFVNDVEDHTESRAAFELTQYALVPRIVVDSTDPAKVPGRLVVGNFHRGLPGAEKMRGLSLVRNYGRGVMLFVRSGP